MIINYIFVWLILVLFMVYLFSDKLDRLIALFKRAPEFKLGKRLSVYLTDDCLTGEEEDFMTTKKGKILFILCIILLVYAIASTFCIVRLNSKINSVYEITQEIKEQI